MITGLQLLARMAAPAVLTVAATAGPSAGVGIQPGPVCAPTTVAQGGTYALPPIQVSDSGSDGVSISLDVIRQSDPRGLHGKPVPASWVTFTYPRTWGGLMAGSSVGVSPGEAALVPARLAIPASAAAGSYVAWIQPQAGTAPVAEHANLTGTGVADLEFQVVRAGTPPRPGVCVTPGEKPAAPAAAAPSAPPAAPARVSGKEALGGGAMIAGGVWLVWRRRRA